MYWLLSFVVGITVLSILTHFFGDIFQKEDMLNTCISIFLAIFCSTIFGVGLICLFKHIMVLIGGV